MTKHRNRRLNNKQSHTVVINKVAVQIAESPTQRAKHNRQTKDKKTPYANKLKQLRDNP